MSATPPLRAKQDDLAQPGVTCGYCGDIDTPQASVTVGSDEVTLCHAADISCYELVTVYGRPLSDGRRWNDHAKVPSQLTLPGMEVLDHKA